MPDKPSLLDLMIPSDQAIQGATRPTVAYGDRWGETPGRTLVDRSIIRINPQAWEAWLRAQPRSTNVEWRGPPSEEDKYQGRYFDVPLSGGVIYRR